MRKYDSALIVCMAEQVTELMGLGILPVSFFCFEFVPFEEQQTDENNGQYEFAGEYIDQQPVIPAWTLEELNIMIGGDFAKPDMYGKDDWTENTNMLHYVVYGPKSAKRFSSGAQAAAEVLIFLLKNKHITAAAVNERMLAFVEQSFYNPQNEALEKSRKEGNHANRS